VSERKARQSEEERSTSRFWIGVILVIVGSWALHQVGSAALVVAVPAAVVGLVLVLAWRRMLPARATRVLTLVGKSKEEDGRLRLRRLSRRGHVWHLAWKVPVGVTVTGLQRQREVIEQALNASVTLWFDRGLVHMRAGTVRLPGTLRFEDFRPDTSAGGELPLAIGASRFGPLWADLAALPHLLVGGLTGGGKTAFVRQLLVGLALRLPPERLRLALLDLKGVEFGLFDRLPHLMAPAAATWTPPWPCWPRWTRSWSDGGRCSPAPAWRRWGPGTQPDRPRRCPTSWSWWTSARSCRPLRCPTARSERGASKRSRISRVSAAWGGRWAST
jgi:FtsK/SpoIIIE family